MKHKIISVIVLCLLSILTIGCSKNEEVVANSNNKNNTINKEITLGNVSDDVFLEDKSEPINEKNLTGLKSEDLDEAREQVSSYYLNTDNFNGATVYLKCTIYSNEKRKEYLDKLNQYDIAVFYCWLDDDSKNPDSERYRQIIVSKKTKDSNWSVFRERVTEERDIFEEPLNELFNKEKNK